MSKAELRRKYTEIRAGITERHERDFAIYRRVMQLPEIIVADLVLCYVSMNTEVDTHDIIEHLFYVECNVAVPRCIGNNLMEFVRIYSLSDLVPGKYGILEPVGGEIAKIKSDTVCIVPGLAFTESGMRLGYGSGFYDKFLADNNVITVGLAYEACLSPRYLPQDSTDIRIRRIITEERTVICDG